MPKLRKVREQLLLAHNDNIINDEEFVLLYDINKSVSPDLPYWTYEKFDLNLMTDDECRTEFRFYRSDIYRLAEVLLIPEEIVCYNGLLCSSTEALCILLKRFAYPCRYLDMVPRFAEQYLNCALLHNI